MRHRNIGDIMRYAIINEGLDTLAHYGDFQPAPGATAFSGDEGTRYSDEQLYALALYTSNKLTPAIGFTVPEDLKKTEDILGFSVRTDPTLALETRRGTGFYKVPSLRGVWYRNGFGHGGQADTLEEWLNPARLEDDYVPRGFHVGPGPIQGHEFGLRLAPADKQALIAFLKTL